jgi:hypothetical protein
MAMPQLLVAPVVADFLVLLFLAAIFLWRFALCLETLCFVDFVFGVTLVVTVVTAVDFAPLVTIVFVVLPPEVVVVFVVCANAGDARSVVATRDAINLFIASSCLRQACAGGEADKTADFSAPWLKG